MEKINKVKYVGEHDKPKKGKSFLIPYLGNNGECFAETHVTTKLKNMSQEDKLNSFIKKSGYWHTEYEQKFGIRITEIKSGCGSMILSRYTNVLKEDFINSLNILIPRLIDNGVGALITTIGEYHSEFINVLEQTGFEKVSTYNNYRHGSNYKQHLYIKKLQKC